jgi:hypothetical protein
VSEQMSLDLRAGHPLHPADTWNEPASLLDAGQFPREFVAVRPRDAPASL